jgi:hypothetical protein
MNGALYCLTVKVRPEGCNILVLLEEDLQPNDLIDKIKESLRKEYRSMNAVTHWAFHWDNHNPLPGDFAACHCVERDDWIVNQAKKVFGWQVA